MKSIFSTQNLQTFFLRKYCRFPRGRPPGPPGPPPPGPPSRRGPPCPPPWPLWPPSRRGAPPGAGACFCSSAIRSTLSLLARPEPGSIHLNRKKLGIAVGLNIPDRKPSLSLLPVRAQAQLQLQEEPPSAADGVRRASRASA